jgi:hypothetical protein
LKAISTRQAPAAEYRLLAHRGEGLQTRVRVMASSPASMHASALRLGCPVGELALAEPMLGAQLLDQFWRRFDAVYGLKAI